MGVLQDFERRLEGAVEGFFARTFRSGLQPVELAKGLQRYARDTRSVTHDGVVVPNVYRFTLNPSDAERLARLGVELDQELAAVAVATAEEEGWILRGTATVLLRTSDEVPVGRYELTARIEQTGSPVAPAPAPAAPPTPAPHERPAPQAEQAPRTPVETPPPVPADATQVLGASGPSSRAGRAAVRVVDGGPPAVVRLEGRTVAGRAPSNGIVLADSTVSREHAAFVRRDDRWWVVDLGSTNGTSVNDTVAAEQPLADGDRIALGDAVLEFVEA